ncbi:MAG: recombination protein RecR [Bacilli bacterium]|nr:recombination protein RecR [Bacilli bacterium]
MYPDIIVKTIESFKKFNGIGEKTAERLALSVLEMSKEDVELFSEYIVELKKNINRCNICGHITDNDVCNICINKFRKDNIICVVEDYKSVIMFEKTGNYEGKYHVLNGVISPIDGITPDELNINSLIERIAKNSGNDTEIIIALKPSIEGEATTLYLKKILEEYNVKITRLSYGIPMGVEIDYLDSITLDRALKDRKDI